jgi:hypothetical protein
MAGAAHRTARRAALVLAVLALVAACAIAPSAQAKKKKLTIVSTSTTAVPLPPGSTQSTTAPCKSGLHITGGGFSISPAYNAQGTPALADDSGVRSFSQISYPSSANAWTTSAGSLTLPSTAGALTAFARCEHNKLGKYAGTVFGSAALNPGDAVTGNLQCPPKSHVLSGGYTVDKPFVFGQAGTSKLFILGSFRSAPNQWTVIGYNINVGAPPVTTLTIYAACEKNAKKLSVSQVQATAPVPDNGVAAVTPSCSKKHHAIGGGFQFAPPTATGTPAPALQVEESAPTSTRAWTVAVADWPPPFPYAAGTAVTGFAYCKSDKVKK